MGTNCSNKGTCCAFFLRGGGRLVKTDQSVVKVGSTKSHKTEKLNGRRFTKSSDIPFSYLKGHYKK